jgi:hypothetical protein
VLADLNPLSPKDRRQVIVVRKNSFFFEWTAPCCDLTRIWWENVGWGEVSWNGMGSWLKLKRRGVRIVERRRRWK